MVFNERYGGVIDFEESKWETWYTKWIGNNNPNFFYAYIFDKETDNPVGEVAYRKDDNTNCAMLNIIIEFSKRGKGYSSIGLIELLRIVFKNGFNEARDLVFNDNISSHILFEKMGFKCIGEVDYAKDYRITLEDYINRYGDL